MEFTNLPLGLIALLSLNTTSMNYYSNIPTTEQFMLLYILNGMNSKKEKQELIERLR